MIVANPMRPYLVVKYVMSCTIYYSFFFKKKNNFQDPIVSPWRNNRESLCFRQVHPTFGCWWAQQLPAGRRVPSIYN